LLEKFNNLEPVISAADFYRSFVKWHVNLQWQGEIFQYTSKIVQDYRKMMRSKHSVLGMHSNHEKAYFSMTGTVHQNQTINTENRIFSFYRRAITVFRRESHF
jgi:hypothetical protein